MFLGREFHNKEGKGLKEGENVADAKGPQLNSPVTDGTPCPPHTNIVQLHFFIAIWHIR